MECGDISGARESLERQLTLNTAISEEGLVNEWGAEVGRTLLATRGDDVAWWAARCSPRAATMWLVAPAPVLPPVPMPA